ncbi:MAG: response regulator [Halioglobus sp.]
MQSDNDFNTTLADRNMGASEEQQDKTVQWLLDQDYVEPSEKLFTLSEEEHVLGALSDYEAEVANRPMFGGEASSDDFSCFVGEEIIMTESGQAADIFAESATLGGAAHAMTVGAQATGFDMAIDHSSYRAGQADKIVKAMDEGSDILGLADEDDIGERFLVMQKTKSKSKSGAVAKSAATSTVAPAAEKIDAEADRTSHEVESVHAGQLVNNEQETPDAEQPVDSSNGFLCDETLSFSGVETQDPVEESDLIENSDVLDLGDELDFSNLTDIDTPAKEETATAELDAGSTSGFLTDVASFAMLGEIESFSDTPQEFEDLSEIIDAPALGADAETSGFLCEIEPTGVIPQENSDAPQVLEMAEVEDIADEAAQVQLTDSKTQEDGFFSDSEAASGTVEQGLSTTGNLEDLESNGTRGFDVFDYVAANEPPVEDEDFDQYLLQGKDFEDRDDSVDTLVVDKTEGVPSVDPQVEEAIDYHEDFKIADSSDSDSVSAIASVIAEVMEEISAAVAQRLGELSVAPDSVQVEVMLGNDEDSVAQCELENFVPVTALSTNKPRALSRLGQPEIDSIYIRLSNIYDAGDWNDLFDASFKTPNQLNKEEHGTGHLLLEEESFDGFDVNEPLDTCFGSLLSPDSESIEDSLDSFGVDTEVPGEEPVADFENTRLTSLAFEEDIFSADISDELLADHDQSSAHSSVETGQPEESIGSFSLEEESAPSSIFDSEVFADETTLAFSDEISTSSNQGDENTDCLEVPADVSPELEKEELTVSAQDTAEESHVFEDDIFSLDLADEFSSDGNTSSFDVEALIHSLADVETDIGEICGVAVDQFAADESATGMAASLDTQVGVASDRSGVDLSWCVPADINFSKNTHAATEIFSDFLDAFIEEGASELEKLEDAIGEWEKDISSETAYAPIPRILHTLKGIAKGVGLQCYGTLIHNFETLLESLARPETGMEAAYFRIINGWLDFSVRAFEQIERGRCDIDNELPSQGTAPVVPTTEDVLSIEQVEVTRQELPQEAESQEPVQAPLDQARVAQTQAAQTALDTKKKETQLADEGAKVLGAQQTIRMTPEALDRLLSLTNEAQQLGVRSSQSTVRSKRAATELLGRLSSVRAHVSKIAERTLLNVTAKGGAASSEMDALEMDQYSELQEAANFLREGVEDLDDLIHLSSRQNTVAEALLKQQASIISSLGSGIQAARVVPVSRLMPGLRRIVRTVSADLGKSVSFRVLNEVGTLDRDNHARCQIILEHMTRNALDHGIEMPEIRAAAGKDTTGSITIEASKQGSDYIVTLSDDGKGIDPEFMRDMAYEKGLDIDVDMLSDEEAIRLIFHKGFSTANEVSEISGRGVGMDIVLSELQHIGGDIEIESTVGVGTTFKVRIPSNVTVNGALLVAAGEVSYAIPLDGLIAVEHVPVDVFYDAIQKHTKLSLFGMECDPAYLAAICHGDALPDRNAWTGTVPVIIAGTEKRYMAIAIDDVTQALELVIRSLGAQFSMIPGLAGGATTADGKSIVALDLNLLVQSAVADELSPVSLRTEQEERMLVLVVDDSRTQRMVATSQFDNLGVETVTAENGLVAIDLLNTTHRLPDVILLDIEMPVKDGIQTLREIRKSPRYSDLPVIMVTSRTGAKHRALAEEAGCNGYMGKPFNFPKLVEQISDLTNHKFQLS